MLTEEQERYFFDLFKNVFYLDDKQVIEESLKDIDRSEVRKKRDRLLVAAEKNSIKLAHKIVNEIKDKDIHEIEGILSSDTQKNFGEELLKEIESELEK